MPVDWNVTWAITRGTSRESNGLKDLLSARRDSSPLGVPTIRVRVPGNAITPESGSGTLEGNMVTGPIGTYTNGFAKIGTTGAVNFEMKYVPFNLTGEGPWETVELGSAFTEGEVPVWIIRNGVNDLAQDEHTTFSTGSWNGTANGNGAVRFSIAAKTSTGDDKLVVKDGKFLGPSDSPTPEIAFTTGGYEVNEEAEVYYAVVPKGDTPDISDYELLDTVEAGDQEETISLDLAQVGEDCDVYVIVYKDGEVSEPLIINTAAGGEDVDWNWGDEPYMSYYVASTGNDSNPGTKAKPVATVQQALINLKEAYSEDASWPEKGSELESPGAIIILDTVTVTEQIDINNTSNVYPLIVLSDDPKTPGGTLQAAATIGFDKSILHMRDGAKVTLAGGLVLAGTGNAEDRIRGVYVSDSTFTMNGGKISGHSIGTGYGGGVRMADDATFIMNGGEISGNSATEGGGVRVAGDAIFTMAGGEIFGNSSIYGGGVRIAGDAIFTMNGGEIFGNFSSATYQTHGGGIYLDADATFTMTGGKISGNFVSSDDNALGGGVYVGGNVIFIMNGGEISGNFSSGPHAYGGGVFLSGNAAFTITQDGVISGNNATSSSSPSTGFGGGIYVSAYNATFTMTGGEIFGNSSSYYGGGVCLDLNAKPFTMTGGKIWGNTSGNAGGGVYASMPLSGGSFVKTGGTIYGSDGPMIDGKDTRNLVKNSSGNPVGGKGHAVSLSVRHKDTTVGPGDNLFYNYPGPDQHSDW
ncbi:MAG: hypothetical protein LBH57_09300 [Treponema sp.]|jgi:hypothetical protein|nr:hypothetical protein [Treponema sp.]